MWKILKTFYFRVPFAAELQYKDEISEIVNIAENILKEFLLTYKNNNFINDGQVKILTFEKILNDYNNFPALKHYIENSGSKNYMQIIANLNKFEKDCYYSALKMDDENVDQSCVLYKAENITTHNHTISTSVMQILVTITYCNNLISSNKKNFKSRLSS